MCGICRVVCASFVGATVSFPFFLLSTLSFLFFVSLVGFPFLSTASSSSGDKRVWNHSQAALHVTGAFHTR